MAAVSRSPQNFSSSGVGLAVIAVVDVAITVAVDIAVVGGVIVGDSSVVITAVVIAGIGVNSVMKTVVEIMVSIGGVTVGVGDAVMIVGTAFMVVGAVI